MLTAAKGADLAAVRRGQVLRTAGRLLAGGWWLLVGGWGLVVAGGWWLVVATLLLLLLQLLLLMLLFEVRGVGVVDVFMLVRWYCWC